MSQQESQKAASDRSMCLHVAKADYSDGTWRCLDCLASGGASVTRGLDVPTVPRTAGDPSWPSYWTEDQKQAWRATAAKIEAQKTAAAVPAIDIQNRRHGAALHDLNEQRVALRNYLYSKMGAEDWHAVSDAACDLREIDAKLSVLRG